MNNFNKKLDEIMTEYAVYAMGVANPDNNGGSRFKSSKEATQAIIEAFSTLVIGEDEPHDENCISQDTTPEVLEDGTFLPGLKGVKNHCDCYYFPHKKLRSDMRANIGIEK